MQLFIIDIMISHFVVENSQASPTPPSVLALLSISSSCALPTSIFHPQCIAHQHSFHPWCMYTRTFQLQCSALPSISFPLVLHCDFLHSSLCCIVFCRLVLSRGARCMLLCCFLCWVEHVHHQGRPRSNEPGRVLWRKEPWACLLLMSFLPVHQWGLPRLYLLGSVFFSHRVIESCCTCSSLPLI